MDIAGQVGVCRAQVSRWRGRYAQSRSAGIGSDLPHVAPPARVDVARLVWLVWLAAGSKPEVAAHWNTRTMPAELGVNSASVSRPWRAKGLKPHLVRSFKISRDPKFAEKLEGVVGLYLSPHGHAIMLRCDEKSQLQAPDRTQPGLPLKKGRASTMAHDDKRNGATTLFAALNVLNVQVTAQRQRRHRHIERLKFLKKIDRETPKDKALYVVADNYAHKHPNVQEWLEKRPRFNMHSPPLRYCG